MKPTIAWIRCIYSDQYVIVEALIPHCAHSGTVACRLYNSIVNLFMIHEGNCHIPIFRPRICAIRISIHLDCVNRSVQRDIAFLKIRLTGLETPALVATLPFTPHGDGL